MKTIIKNIKEIKLYSFNTSLPGKLFFFIHLLIISIFMFILLFSGKITSQITVNENTAFTNTAAKEKIKPLCTRWYQEVVYLSWLGNESKSNGYYLVERFEKGKRSKYIDLLPVKTEKTSTLYSIADKNPATGNFYYKVWFISGNTTLGESDKLFPEKEL